MYIGNDKTIGTIPVEQISFGSNGGLGYSRPMTVNTKDEGRIGTLYLTKEPNEDISYFEWCKGNTIQGFGIKVKLEELVGFLESRTPQD